MGNETQRREAREGEHCVAQRVFSLRGELTQIHGSSGTCRSHHGTMLGHLWESLTMRKTAEGVVMVLFAQKKA